MNTRDMSQKQIMDNADLAALVKALGLNFGKNYDSVKELRYGSILIVADQDY